MPDHTLSLQSSKTWRLNRSFLHSTISRWNSLPGDIVKNTTDNDLQAFKSRDYHYIV